MSYRPRRGGVHATINGTTYPARFHSGERSVAVSVPGQENPDPAVFVWDDTESRWLAELSATDCARVFQVSPCALFLGRPCQVEEIRPDGGAEIVYSGHDFDWARRHGFVQTDPGTWRRTVAVAELADYHEEQWDLMFAEWCVHVRETRS